MLNTVNIQKFNFYANGGEFGITSKKDSLPFSLGKKCNSSIIRQRLTALL
jgi:hypothetical protein